MSEAANKNRPTRSQLIAYIDLPGFRSVLADPNEASQHDILTFLRDLAAANRNFRINVERTSDTQRATSIHPAVTSFSDNIVLTFDLETMRSAETGIYSALMVTRATAGRIAHRARAIGCLIRGAVTMGPLYHDSGVVFGRGLVEAYEMETRTAVFPRIIISPPVLDKVQGDRAANAAMFCDDDGFWCLDYMTADLEDIDEVVDSGPSEVSSGARRAWAYNIRATARQNAQELLAGGNKRGADNWSWFTSRFEKSMAAVNPYRFNVDGSPLVFPE